MATSKKNLKNLSKSGVKSTRGRKAFITPENLDLTGKNHIMIVRSVQNTNERKKNNNSCINCDSNYQYTELISQNIDRLENLVNNLGKVISKEQKPKEFSINNLDKLDFTKMNTDTLIKCSTLFNTRSPQPQSSVKSFNSKNSGDDPKNEFCFF
ncbi:204_t:CDS:1 [Diversispora eburnea]|uniref:204_t:CDS:1 n=1 Tax=Diversispora eburnea TaxID=1213867 RepID=A0A9N8WC91_9GLOM|nr:204_t:CDS:1 [Diversispora eburnea]